MIDRINEDILPNALMIGVDYDLFWTLTPKSLEPFIKAFSMKQKQDDFNNWSAGRYIQMAISSVFGKNSKYPSKPLSHDKDVSSDKQEIEVLDAEEIKRRFSQHAMLLNSRFESR